MEEKVKATLGGWKKKVLSQAGRMAFIQSVVQPIPMYHMQITSLPKTCYKEIDAHILKFWWGSGQENQKKLCLKVWDYICCPKEAGSIGLKRMEDMNRAFNTKLAWQMCTNQKKVGCKPC